LELPRHLFDFSPSSLERATQVAQMRTVRLHMLFEDSFSEHSFHYIFQNMLANTGISKASLPLDYQRLSLGEGHAKSFRSSIERFSNMPRALRGGELQSKACSSKNIQ
jgi:hypothetical protein